ncbi:MAG: hypothetical protein AB1422_04510 [bacterium]
MKIKGLGARDSGIKESPNPLIPRQRGDKKIKICVIYEICGLFSGERVMSLRLTKGDENNGRTTP